MKKLLLFLFMITPINAIAADREDWILHYMKGDQEFDAIIWLNSKKNFVISSGKYYSNIPCGSQLGDKYFVDIDAIIQKLIQKEPRQSKNLNSNECNDETRVRFQIALKPGSGVSNKGQLLLVEDYSIWKVCNTDKIEPLWLNLAEKLETITKIKLEKCSNSPFSNDNAHNKKIYQDNLYVR